MSGGAKMYYNTTNVSGEQLPLYREKAKSQEDLVMWFFNNHPPGMHASPEDIHEAVFPPEVPLTSVRRAMSDLTHLGYLERTEYKTLGRYGRDVHMWRLADD